MSASVTVTLNLLGVRPFTVLEETMVFAAEPPPTLEQLIELVERRNPGFRQAVLNGAKGGFSRQFAVLVNGMNAEYSGGLARVLLPGDEVNVIPAIAGG